MASFKPARISDFGNTFAQVGHRFRAGKNGTNGVEGDGRPGLQSQYRRFQSRGTFKNIGDHFQKTAGTAGAFIIHDEIGDFAFAIDADGLAVLSAHIQNGAHRREKVVDTAGMAADFRDIFIGKGHQHAAVPGGHDIVNVFDLQSGAFQGFGHGDFGGDHAFRPGIPDI